LDRDELFEKGRGEILDEVVALGQLSAKQWEEMLNRKLWSRVASYVFDSIYMPAAASTNNAGTFNTTVDIKLKEWADRLLPERCVEVGWETLREGFSNLVEKSKTAKDHDAIFDSLKQAVVEEACSRHSWEDKVSSRFKRKSRLQQRGKSLNRT
jgi:optic atrophy protein 1